MGLNGSFNSSKGWREAATVRMSTVAVVDLDRWTQVGCRAEVVGGDIS